MSNIPDAPDGLNEAVSNFRAALRLADEQSEGTYYAAFWTAVAHLQSRVDTLVNQWRPGVEVKGSLRLPPSPGTDVSDDTTPEEEP